MAFLDSSIPIAAMVTSEDHHQACFDLLAKPGSETELGIFSHGFAECFSTLTGGRRGIQMSADIVAVILKEDYRPKVLPVGLEADEMLLAMRDAQSRGVRGGGIYDYLHLVAARKAKAARIYTLNIRNFEACHRPGDPEIVHPGH